jgi:outer membrane protein assembly factor BamB
MKRVMMGLVALSLLGGCGVIHHGKKPATPTVGKRISVLTNEAAIEVDPGLTDVTVAVPPPAANKDWPQSGGNAAKSVGHLTIGTNLGAAWTVKAGEGSSTRVRLAAAPVVGDGRVYVVDTSAELRAFDVRNGVVLWQAHVGDPKENAAALFGGGASFDNGRVYATNGVGNVVAFDAATGKQVWIVRPGGPLRGSPTIANDNVYVVSQDNQLYALNPADGSIRWQQAASIEQAGVLGVASPASASGTVVAGFSSGELTAFRYENGRALWQDVLTRTTIATSVGILSDIDASPVIDNSRVYAIGQGGRMVALELNTGQRVWEINIAGISTPWVAGDWIYVVTDQAQLLCIARSNGHVRWISQLPRWHNSKKKEGAIFWRGPVLAGNRLIVVGSNGGLLNVSAADGSQLTGMRTGERYSLSPVVAGDTLFVLSDEGRLTAWR